MLTGDLAYGMAWPKSFQGMHRVARMFVLLGGVTVGISRIRLVDIDGVNIDDTVTMTALMLAMYAAAV